MRSRPTLTAALLFLAMAILFVNGGLLPGKTLSNSDSFSFKAPFAASKPADLVRPANPEFDDAPAQYHPWARYNRRELPDIPLWNPYVMTGRPFEANSQSAVFSPFWLPAWVLPFWTALGWIAVLKLWTAAFGMYVLGRRLAMNFAGGMVAGTAYGFSLWLVCWLSYPHAGIWALIPFMLVAADRALKRPDVLGTAPLAVMTGLVFLCGHAESSFHAVLATTILIALRLFGTAWKRPLVWAAGGLAVGGLLAFLTLLPFVELLLGSADIEQRAGTAIDSAAPKKWAFHAFMPDWQGRPTQLSLEFFMLARAWYAGALALLLAAAALVLRPSRGRIATAFLGFAAMSVVLGVPPIFDVVARLPIFSTGHNTRLAMLALLCLALLAGWGLTDLLDREVDRRRRRILLAVLGLLFLFPIAYALRRVPLDALGDGLEVAWGFAEPRSEDAVRANALWVWVVVAGLGTALLAAMLRAGPVWRSRLAAAVVVLLFADLCRAGMGYNPVIDRDDAVQPDTPALKIVRAGNPARMVATGDIPQNTLAFDHGVYETRGYDLPIEKRFDRLWRTALSPEFGSQVGSLPAFIPLSLPRVNVDRLRVLGALGTRYVMQPPNDPRLQVAGLELVHDGLDARLYRNPFEQPRAAVVASQQTVDGEDAALEAVLDDGFQITGAAVTEEPIDGLAEGGDGPAGRASVDEIGNDRLTVTANAQRAGLLVVSDAWDRGWKATVDGREAEVHRVNYVMRGVKVPAGTSKVEFRYEPLTWRIGWIVSLVTLLGLGLAVLIAWRRQAR